LPSTGQFQLSDNYRGQSAFIHYCYF